MRAERRPTVTLRARHVVTMTGRVLENGWLRLSAGRIVALGTGGAPGPTVDLGDAIVLPGLVNAHTHLEFSALAEPLDGTGGLPAWIDRVVTLRRARPTGSADAGAAIRRGLAESSAAGVTMLGEIATGCHADVFTGAGPRVRVFREALGLTAAGCAAARAAVQRDTAWLAAAGVPAGISPHAPYSVAAGLGRGVLDIARRAGLPAAMHLAESPDEEEFVGEWSGPFRAVLEALGAWPEGPPRLLPAADWISLLARGPRGLVVHGTYLDDVALTRLSRHRDRLAVVVCPRTTQLLAGRLPPLARFRSAGIRVALGTDSRASSPDLSVLGECRALVDGGLASPAEVLAMATVDGAWALGFDRRAGRLAPGRAADLTVLRPSHPARDPHAAVLDPAAEVVATLRAGNILHGSLQG